MNLPVRSFQKGQIDLFVRYRYINRNQRSTRYFHSAFLQRIAEAWTSVESWELRLRVLQQQLKLLTIVVKLSILEVCKGLDYLSGAVQLQMIYTKILQYC